MNYSFQNVHWINWKALVNWKQDWYHPHHHHHPIPIPTPITPIPTPIPNPTPTPSPAPGPWPWLENWASCCIYCSFTASEVKSWNHPSINRSICCSIDVLLVRREVRRMLPDCTDHSSPLWIGMILKMALDLYLLSDYELSAMLYHWPFVDSTN